MSRTFMVLGIEVASYRFFTIVGMMVGMTLCFRAFLELGLSKRKTLGFLLFMALGFLVGARLWNVLVNPSNFGDALPWYSFRLVGLSLYGGIFGTGIVLLLGMKILQKPLFPLLDRLVVPSTLAFSLARVGCFLNGCCIGIATNGPLGMIFPSKVIELEALQKVFPYLSTHVHVHPTQLYELFGALVGLVGVYVYRALCHPPAGSIFLLYGAWFSLVRLLVLPLRALGYPRVVTSVLYPGLYLFLILLCLVLFGKNMRTKELSSWGKKEKASQMKPEDLLEMNP
ncbi:MAG TPA: hypothetical protein DEA52_00630 [Clostridiaceae bacterium]|nr:hypothetical protein [Clostridiaceae bacterium]